MGWWIALGVVFLLGILPLGVSARYGGRGRCCGSLQALSG